ncbi:RarC (conservon) homologue [Streptomyces scabiei 87.22]|uniref:RarC (Conservon) homologue n=1 Tax=Streptomyces scabiei (strain 87.22) TaxID=680198 RepID=C9ZDF3_STRSW|nr:RarC (conservon) homologue [Streptomyces scabiei 87.22]
MPAYVATSRHSAPRRNTFGELTRLKRCGGYEPAGLDPPQTHLLHLLAAGSLTVVEVSAHLRLTVHAVCVVACSLVDAGLVEARAPIPEAEKVDTTLLERVLVGLQRDRFG